MFKAIILITEIFLLCGCAASSRTAHESLTGRWEGVAQISGTKTKAIVDFIPDANGSFNATISVPDERLLGKTLTNVRYEPPHLHFELQASERTIIFDGSLRDRVIYGAVSGGDISTPLFLRHIGKAPPTPYAPDEGSFRKGDVALSGAFVIPPTKRGHPARVLLS